MQYQRSFEIEKRLERVLELIQTGEYSTPQIAEILDVSIPTISRDVNALRERGHAIRAEKRADGWRYLLTENDSVRNTINVVSDRPVQFSESARRA